MSVHGNRELSGSDDHFVLLLATMVKVARDTAYGLNLARPQ